jgi:hypothetical protein
VNWDSVLLHTLPLVESATTNDEFNNAIDTILVAAGPMALSTTYFPDTLAPELKRNRDFSWIGTTILRTDVQVQLDTIKNNFRPHTGCWMINSFYPVFPYDSVELNVNTTVSYPDMDHRLLMLFKYWNIIRYFNPYNYVLDIAWDTTLYNYAVPIANSPNSNSLYLLFTHIAATLDDAHVFGYSGSLVYQQLPGFYQPYLRLKYTQGSYVVAKSMVPGINAGDAIISIDGLTTTQWEDSLMPYYSSGNLSVFRRFMCEHMMGRQVVGTNESLIIEDSLGTTNTITTSCIWPISDYNFFEGDYYFADSLDSIKWTTMPCNIGYVNMANLQASDVNAMYTDLNSKSAIIFDLRQYPSNAGGVIANLLLPNKKAYAKLTTADASYPGTCSWIFDSVGVNGNLDPYTGKVILLMNEYTISMGEFTCMILETMPNVVKIGSQTSGADGTVVGWKLSQDLITGFSSNGVFYPNGDSTQRIGIVPDTLVYATRAGIRHNRDEVLEKALSVAGCGLETPNVQVNKTVVIAFPNPANDVINIGITNLHIADAVISLTDITGRVLMQQTAANIGGQIASSFDTHALAAGMYFVTVNADGRQYVRKIAKE